MNSNLILDIKSKHKCSYIDVGDGCWDPIVLVTNIDVAQNIFTQFCSVLLSQLNFIVRTSVSFFNENYNIGNDGNAFERYNFGYTFPNDDRSIKRIHFRRMKMTF